MDWADIINRSQREAPGPGTTGHRDDIPLEGGGQRPVEFAPCLEIAAKPKAQGAAAHQQWDDQNASPPPAGPPRGAEHQTGRAEGERSVDRHPAAVGQNDPERVARNDRRELATQGKPSSGPGPLRLAQAGAGQCRISPRSDLSPVAL